MAVSDEWRWTDDQGVQRVVRADELRSALASSVLAPSTLVWREGMAGWVPAFTVPELGAGEGAGAIAEPLTDGTTTDMSHAPRIDPPSIVQASKVVPNAPERIDRASRPRGGVEETGRPTPTELLADGSRASRAKAAPGAPKPAAGAETNGSPLKIGAAPKPGSAGASRPGAGKVESASTASKLNVPRPTTAPGWRKGELGKSKSDEELTLVAEGGEPFKVKPGADGGSNGATPPGPAAAKLTAPEPGKSRVAASLPTRRPFTQTALLGPNETPRPAAVKLPSTVPPPPMPAGARRPASVPPAPMLRRPSSAPPARPDGATQGRRSTAVLSSGAGSVASKGLGGIHVPAPPRVPGPARPVFNIVENTSTDSTGVLPLGGKYAAEPKPEAAASFGESASAFAERTPSFPDGGAVSSQAGGAALADASRAPLRSQPPPTDASRAPLRSQPPPTDTSRAPLRSQPPPTDGAYGYGPVVGAHASYPPAPVPLALDPARNARLSGPRLEAEARAAAGLPPTRMPMRSEPPPGAGMPHNPYADSSAPYSAPMPPLALGEPSIGEIRATGALPLVNPKQRSYPPVPDAEAPAPTDSLPGSVPLDSIPPPGKVTDPVVVPMSSLLGAGGILIAMAIMAFFVGRCSVAPGPTSQPARAALAALPRLARASLPSPPKPCWMAKQPVRWAPSVIQSVPVDLAPSGSGVVVAYARDIREPATVQVDFAAGTFDDTPAEKRDDELVRVFAPRDGSGLLATTKSDEGPLAPYVYATGASPFVIGVAGRGTPSPSVAVAEKPDGTPETLWSVPAVEEDKGLEAARVLTLGPSRHALVFRRSGNILGGFLGEGRKADGVLTPVAGSGGSVGKPALGTNQREIAVVFADKAGADAAWEIRVGHAPLGQMPRETVVVPLPKGGPGGDAFAPDVAGTPDGRWVLVWTEGKTGGYAVRAQTFSVDWKTLGDPIAISPPAGNFGQAVVGAFGNYVTTMFLSKGSSGSYELWGAVLQCGS